MMEDALNFLRTSVDDQEFLRLTRTSLRIAQNLLNEPETAKYRTVLAACKYAQRPGVSQLLKAMGFRQEGDAYVIDPAHIQDLVQRKTQIIASRKEVGTVQGWDVPSSSLKFSLLQSKGKFGDVFLGRMDEQDVMVKVVQPDCNQEAKCAFDRELDILSKISHPHIVELLAVTLTSEPVSLILEHIPRCLLDVLHSSEVPESEVLKYAQQLGSAMSYLHQKDILHCDLAARNLLLDGANKLRLSEFGLARWADTLSCQLPSSAKHLLNTRWMSPEVLKDLAFSKPADIWSYGVVLYELLTGGSVPYATLSTSEVLSKVEGGVRLSQPQGCPEELYHVMQMCWAQRPSDRPQFGDLLKAHLEPLLLRLASNGDAKSPSTPVEEEHKGLHHKSSKKLKVKEPSYQSVLGKGGALIRVYTALVSPLQHRVVVVCSRKTSVGEVVATALAKCGKQDQDSKNHKMVLVSGPTSGSPAHYLDPEDKIVPVKSGAPPTAMFVLCVNMPGQAPLEILDSIRQNPAYGSAFSGSTRGYLVRREGSQAQRSWCVLDGCTLLCYREEEDEGMKQFESYLDFKDCTVELSSKGKNHVFKVTTLDNSHHLFLANSKDDMLQWVESINSSKPLDPSPLLLHATGGAVIHTGFMTCQEFASESEQDVGKPLKSKISDVDFSGTFAIDYGKHWTVLRSSGLVQCLVKGRPETLLNLADCQRVNVNNPKEMREGADYCIEVDNAESKFVLRAELPTDHSDWVLAIEQILMKLDHSKLLQGHRKRESGYVALKRLLLTSGGRQQQQQQLNNGRASQLYCFPRIVDDMEDIYDASKIVHTPPPKSHPGPRSELLQRAKPPKEREPSPLREISTSEGNVMPLPPRDLPPPLPPRREPLPPPLPPKARPIVVPRPTSVVSTTSSCSDGADDDYIMMQSSSLSSVPPSPLSVHQPPTPRSYSMSSSSPISIPNRRTSKRSILLRGDSESSSCANSPPPINNSLRSLHEGVELSGMEIRKHSIGSSSLHRQNSNQSLGSSFGNITRRASSEHPSLPPRNGEKQSSGYTSPIFPCSGGKMSQSSTMAGIASHGFPSAQPGDFSRSDGMTVTELQQYHRTASGKVVAPVSSHHPISKAGSIPRQLASSYASEGYGSTHSSLEDLSQLPPGWERGYCENSSRYFYFNSLTGASIWSLQEVLAQKNGSEDKPGTGWKMARTEDNRIYYYNEATRQTTWNIQDTLTVLGNFLK